MICAPTPVTEGDSMPRSPNHPIKSRRPQPRPEPQHYLQNCVDWPYRFAADLSDMLSSGWEITYPRFLYRIDRSDLAFLEGNLGYSKKFPMKDDGYVTYHSGLIFGTRCYYFRHSAIEYVFAPRNVRETMQCRSSKVTVVRSPWSATFTSDGHPD